MAHSEKVTTERARVQRWVDGTSGWWLDRRERLLHQLGLATSHDLDKLSRQLKALRGRLQSAQRETRRTRERAE